MLPLFLEWALMNCDCLFGYTSEFMINVWAYSCEMQCKTNIKACKWDERQNSVFLKKKKSREK